MKQKISYIILTTIVLSLLVSCSLKKNTWSTRTYQAINTQYNVYFNGLTSYEEGIKNIANANKEDYSSIIPMYPISKHDNASAATANMDRAIEKCRKAIKQRSIKQKPERNMNKWRDPEYQLWYKQEEFNPAMKNVWLLLAKSEFHKADFIGSTGTFSYIIKHYSSDKDMVAQCQLWIVRAYAETGWIYEAQEVLSKVKQDDLKAGNIGLFADVNADLLLKQKQYKDAIPFLELALKKEHSKIQKQRFNFLLAQLYTKTGDKKAAYNAYSKVIKLNPSYEMDFNARIYRIEVGNETGNSVRKELNRMLKNTNNKDYLDQIYFAIGDTYMQQKDTAKAIENYKLSVAKSTRNGFDKAHTLITLGDLYYNRQQYVKAQPCYDEASKIITADNDDYARVAKRAESLSELVSQYEIVTLQDSLQHLATLTQSQKMVVINKLIEKVKADEKAAAEAQKLKASNNMSLGDDAMPVMPIGASPATGEWYFYNSLLMKSGQREFLKQWGNRKLEDNWRRASKTSTLFTDDTNQSDSAQDSLNENNGDKANAKIDDNKNPEFYLRQIPATAAQLQKSNDDLATALYNMGMIYKEKVEDFPMAIKTFDEFSRRFPKDKRREETLFQSYMLETKMGNTALAYDYKNQLISYFPKSKYAEVLSQPDYFARMERMYHEQDSLYAETYQAYNQNNFSLVKRNTQYIKQNFPLSALLPKFLFLNALSTAKTDKQENFENELNTIVNKYPDSDVSSMAKDMLALIKQGRESKTGTTGGSLINRREETIKQTEQVATTTQTKQFSTDKTSKHRLLLLAQGNKETVNKLLFNIASYNFTKFMVKDFDMVVTATDSTQSTIAITNFNSYDETSWYLASIENDPNLSQLLRELKVEPTIISEDNFGIAKSVSSLSAYKKFQAQYLEGPDAQKTKTLKPETLAMLGEEQAATQVVVANTKTAPEVKTNKPAQTGNKAVQTENKPAPTAPQTQPAAVAQQTPAPTPQKAEENVPLYKGLFGYRANDPHYVAIVVLSGDFDFEKLKTAFNAYDAQNYGMLNLQVNMESVNNQKVIIVGSFADANIAKSYLFRMVKEKSVMDMLKGTDYRNLMGSQKNLNIMMQKNAMSTYLEFMKEYYLK